MNIITKEDERIILFFKTLKELLAAIENLLAGRKPLLNGEHYLTDQEVADRLKVGRRTLQDYRNQGLIPYIKLGGKILYKSSDLERILSDNYYDAWNSPD